MPLYADTLATVNEQRAAIIRQRNTLQNGLTELSNTLTQILTTQQAWLVHVQAGNMDAAELAAYQAAIAASVSLTNVANAVKALGLSTGGAVAAVACTIDGQGNHTPIQTTI